MSHHPKIPDTSDIEAMSADFAFGDDDMAAVDAQQEASLAMSSSSFRDASLLDEAALDAGPVPHAVSIPPQPHLTQDGEAASRFSPRADAAPGAWTGWVIRQARRAERH